MNTCKNGVSITSATANSASYINSQYSCDNFSYSNSNSNQPNFNKGIEANSKLLGDYINNNHFVHQNQSKIESIEENGNQCDNTGYIALDQLLESLAIENDLMERHLYQINSTDGKNGSNYGNEQTAADMFTFNTSVQDNCYFKPTANENAQNTKINGFHDENLNEVIANLTEYSENELQRQQSFNHHTHVNGHHQSITTKYQNQYQNNEKCKNHPQQINHLNNHYNFSNHIRNGSNIISNHIISSNHVLSNGHNANFINNTNNNHINNSNNHSNYHRSSNYQEPCINAIKRLTSESENSSSVSPSLSERSNGIVSWNDQVMMQYQPI